MNTQGFQVPHGCDVLLIFYGEGTGFHQEGMNILTGAEDQTEASSHAATSLNVQSETCSRAEYLSQILDILLIQLAEILERDLRSLEFLHLGEEQRHSPAGNGDSRGLFLMGPACALRSCSSPVEVQFNEVQSTRTIRQVFKEVKQVIGDVL